MALVTASTYVGQILTISRQWLKGIVPRLKLRAQQIGRQLERKTYRLRKRKPKPPKGPCFFNRLPFELREMIWQMAMDERRIVIIRPATRRPSRQGGFMSSTPVPPTLHVCSKSRSVALKKYKFHFGKTARKITFNKDEIVTVHPPRVYFTYDQDILYFRQVANLKFFTMNVDGEEHQRIYSYALDVDDADPIPWYDFWYYDISYLNFLNDEYDPKEIHLGVQSTTIDTNDGVRMLTLRKEDEGRFVRAYKFVFSGHELAHATKPPRGRVELVRDDCELDKYPSMKRTIHIKDLIELSSSVASLVEL